MLAAQRDLDSIVDNPSMDGRLRRFQKLSKAFEAYSLLAHACLKSGHPEYDYSDAELEARWGDRPERRGAQI